MFRLLSTIFLVSVGIFLYSYFRELNPGTITVRTSPDALFELSPVSLVLFSMALGATLVALIVTISATRVAPRAIENSTKDTGLSSKRASGLVLTVIVPGFSSRK